MLCLIDIYSKNALVIPLKDTKGITIANAFQKFLDESNRKPNKIFFDRSMKSWLEKKCFRKIHYNLKIKIYECMTFALKKVYIYRLDNIANKYNNTYHSTISSKLMREV